MRPMLFTTALACAALICIYDAPADAHVIAGSRVFPVTLTFDDPGVSDEASLPAFSYQPGATNEYDVGAEYDKTITPNTALIFNDGYDYLQTRGAKTEQGLENLYITGKWQAYTNDEHEFVVSAGIIREIGGTGAVQAGADAVGSTAPTGYFGKGFGDMPIGVFRPFAITGEFGYTIADKALKALPPAGGMGFQTSALTGLPAVQYNNGSNNFSSGGLSLQYSIPYLQSQVKNVGISGVFANMIPVAEFTWTTPATAPSSEGVGNASWTAAPGVIYLAQWGEVGLEALVPMNKAAGSNVGAVLLVHFFFDDLFPNSIGKALIQ